MLFSRLPLQTSSLVVSPFHTSPPVTATVWSLSAVMAAGTYYNHLQRRCADDDDSVETSADFDRLSAEYNRTTGPNSPAQSSQSQMTTDCPAINGSLLASTDLPPTPDEAVCNCINQNAFACRVRPETAASPAIIGSLTE